MTKIDWNNRIVPSQTKSRKRVPGLGSTLAVLEALPEGGWLLVPPSWREWAEEHAPARGVKIVSDEAGIHGRFQDIPAGAVVGVGVGFYDTAHEATRIEIRKILTGKRFSKVIWA